MLEKLPLLSILIFLPLLGGIFVAAVDQSTSSENARKVGMWVSSATFLLAVFMAFKCLESPLGSFIFKETLSITEVLGLEYQVGIDRLSLLFVLVTTLMFPIAIFASWDHEIKELKFFIFLLLTLETLILGSLCSLNLLAFYIFFESVVAPVYFLTNLKKGISSESFELKNVLYTLIGSIFLLISLLKIFNQTETFSYVLLTKKVLSPHIQMYLFWGFLVAFLIKLPAFPLHTWLSYAYNHTYGPVSMLISGVVTKLSLYAILRFNLTLFPDALFKCAAGLKWFFAFSFLHITLGLYAKRYANRFFAHLDLSHVSLSLVFIFFLTKEALSASIFHIFITSICIPGVYFLMSTLVRRLNTDRIKFFGGIGAVMPQFSVLFFLGCYLISGLPGSPFFVSFLTFSILHTEGSYLVKPLIFISGLIFSISLLWLYRRTVFGIISEALIRGMSDLTKKELLVGSFFLILMALLGIVPWVVYGFIDNISETLIMGLAAK